MRLIRIQVALVAIAAAISMGSCGAAVDPLVGSWKVVWPAGSINASVTSVYAFNADKTLLITASRPDSTTKCTSTSTNGGTWSASGNMLAITLSSGTGSTTGCTNASMNLADHPVTGFDTSPQAFTYSTDSATLTVTRSDGSTTMFARQ